MDSTIKQYESSSTACLSTLPTVQLILENTYVADIDIILPKISRF